MFDLITGWHSHMTNSHTAKCGHSDVATTARYFDIDLEKEQQALKKFLKLDVERMVGTRSPGSSHPPGATLNWFKGL
jgi:hypothetical protein